MTLLEMLRSHQAVIDELREIADTRTDLENREFIMGIVEDHEMRLLKAIAEGMGR